MSRVTPAGLSFNGGETSQRLSARVDQAIYAISLGTMTGFAPLVEGPAEAIPGTLHVGTAPGPFRALKFQFNSTQGHVIEASHLLFRIYTNDVLLESAPGVPVTVASPYSWAQVQALTTFQSYDVLYCFHPAMQPRKFVRTGPTSFAFELWQGENGPFDPRNKDRALRVSASALSGAVNLAATAAVFAASDVGSLFQMEAEDFGDTPAWEPGITVTAGALRTSEERVYRAVSAGRTGGLQPVHTEGVEWDGSKEGTDINDKPAPGVQWEYLHDRYGIVQITAFTSATAVAGTVLRHLPFSSVGTAPGSGNYGYAGGYDDPAWDAWLPPAGAVDYAYGTWRWRFGSFSDTRGWPTCGAIWNERLCLAKDTTVFCSVAGDLDDFASVNELGDVSLDMAVQGEIDDPNAITALVADDTLLICNAAGTFTLGPANAAQGFGPTNRRFRRHNDAGCGAVPPLLHDGRLLHVDPAGRAVNETDFDAQRNTEAALDLNRYARHIGKRGRRIIGLASQHRPHRHLWAVRQDGTLACANYLPDEQVLGWANRPLAPGVLARSIVAITDPDGQDEQLWIAAQYGAGWHMLRLAPWREDGEYDDNAVMTDLAVTYAGAATGTLTAPLLAGQVVDVVADGAFYLERTLSEAGAFALPDGVTCTRAVIGLRFDAEMEGLALEAGGDSGPAIAKMGQIGRAWVQLLHARGLEFGTPDRLVPLAQLQGGDLSDTGWSAQSGFRLLDAAGEHTREPRFKLRRVAPAQATVLAWGGSLDKASK